MKPTKEQEQELIDAIRHRAYVVWQIQLAAKTGDLYSGYHPEQIKRSIADLETILSDAAK